MSTILKQETRAHAKKGRLHAGGYQTRNAGGYQTRNPFHIGIGISESGKGVPDVGWERPQKDREWGVAVSGGGGIYMPGSIYMLESIHVGSKSRRPGDGPYRVDGGMGETAQ